LVQREFGPADLRVLDMFLEEVSRNIGIGIDDERSDGAPATISAASTAATGQSEK